MQPEFIDPVVAGAVTQIVNRFGEAGLDQLECAAALARPDAQRARLALDAHSRGTSSRANPSISAVDEAEGVNDRLAQSSVCWSGERR